MKKLVLCLLLIPLLLSVVPTKATTTRESVFERIATETAVTTEAERLVATPCVDGTAAGYPCNEVDLMSFLPLNAIGGGSGNDIWGWTDSTTGKEYALMGRTSGTSFVDISDPENPIYLGNLPTHTSNSSWRDIKVYQDHAFVVSEAGNHGMQIFDLTQLRNVSNPPQTFSNTAHFGNFGSAHNIVINEDSGYAYAVGAGTCSGGLHMVNIQNPISPVDAGCFSSDGYTHDAQCVIYNGPDTEHVGQEICLNSNEDTLTVVDVTRKGSPVQLSRTPYSGSRYTHQGWLTEDHAYFLLNDELDEQGTGVNTTTYIWDVRNLDNPTMIGTYVSSNAAIDHNLYIHQGLAYESNYTSGLRILSTANIANAELSELAYFDVYPQSNSATFSGTWSNYPYYESGVVAISSIDRGLFIVKPTLTPDFAVAPAESTVQMCSPGSTSVDVGITSILNFANPVTLGLTGLPTGVNAQFTPDAINPGTMSTLEFTAAAAGTASAEITISGESGGETRTATVMLNQLEAPIMPTLVNPENGSMDQSRRPVLTWQGTGGATYVVEISTNSDFSDAMSATVNGNTYQPAVNLDAATTYYWRVKGSNPCGDTAYVSGSFTTEAAPVTAGSAEVAHATGFENADRNGWTGGNWSVTTADAHTGDSSLHAIGNSTAGSKNTTSPTFDLPTDKANLRLHFWHSYNLNGDANGCEDAGTIEVRVNGQWQTLNSEIYGDSYTAAITSSASPYAGMVGYCGSSSGWQEASIDLDAFAGQSVRFRFRLLSDGADASEGWYVDDIQLSYYDGGYKVYMPFTTSE